MFSKLTLSISLFFLLLANTQVHAQDNPDMYTDKWFLIIASKKTLDSAYSIAREASLKTNIEYNRIILTADTHSTAGLTFTKEDCEDMKFEYPCYVARGRSDDGTYISIESSSSFMGFTCGLFMVIAGSGSKNDAALKEALKKVQQYYPDSYIKHTKVYMGCMH